MRSLSLRLEKLVKHLAHLSPFCPVGKERFQRERAKIQRKVIVIRSFGAIHQHIVNAVTSARCQCSRDTRAACEFFVDRSPDIARRRSSRTEQPRSPTRGGDCYATARCDDSYRYPSALEEQVRLHALAISQPHRRDDVRQSFVGERVDQVRK